MAPRFGMAPGLQSRFGRGPLGLERSSISHFRVAPGYRLPFGHVRREPEEIYLVLSGSARVELDDDIVELGEWDAVRIPPGTARSFEGGPDGAELLAYGAPSADNNDVEMLRGWWSE